MPLPPEPRRTSQCVPCSACWSSSALSLTPAWASIPLTLSRLCRGCPRCLPSNSGRATSKQAQAFTSIIGRWGKQETVANGVRTEHCTKSRSKTIECRIPKRPNELNQNSTIWGEIWSRRNFHSSFRVAACILRYAKRNVIGCALECVGSLGVAREMYRNLNTRSRSNFNAFLWLLGSIQWPLSLMIFISPPL